MPSILGELRFHFSIASLLSYCNSDGLVDTIAGASCFQPTPESLMLMRRSLVVICRAIGAGVVLTVGLFSSAQFVGGNPQSVEERVDDLLAKMTLDEKIDLISGDTPFRTHSISRLN